MIRSRFESKFTRGRKNECWLWSGTRLVSGGYGVLVIGRRKYVSRAHRLSYEIYKGAIPDGLLVCHSCDEPACVNPHHLWLGTAGDNARDMVTKGRRHDPFQGRTHCKNGHKKTKANTYVRPDGKAVCRTCKSMYNLAAYHRSRRKAGFATHSYKKRS
ncbi:MAG: HNH endonuclease signature motif containing protein [Methyloceanibacter sp.]